MPMTQQERAAADIRVRSALGLNRKGTAPDAPPIAPRAGAANAVTASTKLPIEDEAYGLQMYGYGEIWGRPGLAIRERSFLTVGLLCAMAMADQLGIHVNNALNVGLTPEEIHETLIHVGIHAGVPMWHNGNNIARYVFLERGILEPGKGAGFAMSPPTTDVERRAAAAEMQRRLGLGRIGLGDDAPALSPLPGGLASRRSAKGVPIERDMRQIQTEYVYGEVWPRPGLDVRTRILISVAVLQALRLDDQLHEHINVALNLGVTPDELHEVFLHAGCYCGVSAWENAVDIANDVFTQRGLLG